MGGGGGFSQIGGVFPPSGSSQIGGAALTPPNWLSLKKQGAQKGMPVRDAVGLIRIHWVKFPDWDSWFPIGFKFPDWAMATSMVACWKTSMDRPILYY